MITSVPAIEFSGVYGKLMREQVHQLISWGFEDARHRIISDNIEEPSITGFIADAINNRFRRLDSPDWCYYYSVKDDPPVEKEGADGKRRPRVDLIMEANFNGRPEYMFEAKRLRKNGFGVSKYIDSEGMGCFIDGLYAKRYREAAMLGYIQSDSLEYWQDKIKSAIDKASDKLCLKPPQRDTKVIDAFPHEWISEHERKSIGRPIAIYHIILDCNPIKGMLDSSHLL